MSHKIWCVFSFSSLAGNRRPFPSEILHAIVFKRLDDFDTNGESSVTRNTYDSFENYALHVCCSFTTCRQPLLTRRLIKRLVEWYGNNTRRTNLAVHLNTARGPKERRLSTSGSSPKRYVRGSVTFFNHFAEISSPSSVSYEYRVVPLVQIDRSVR